MIYQILPSTLAHLRVMARDMRPMDRAEIEGLGLCVRHTLQFLWRDSLIKRAAIVDGQVAAVWGCQGAAMDEIGVPWLFTTPVVERAKLAFWREARHEIAEMLGTRRVLRTRVLASYSASIRFFRKAGFSFGPPEAIGKTLYRTMTMERENRISPPFIVLGLPRSRTAWLARFLTYGGWKCHHEMAIQMRRVSDIVDFFNRPMTGSCETGAAQGYWLLRHYVPHIRTVVLRRPVDEVIKAVLKMNVGGLVEYDESVLRRNMEYGDRVLDRIAKEPDVLTVDYADLNSSDACAAVFEHCLPFQFDRDWWNELRGENIQADPIENLLYYHANHAGVEGFKSACKRELYRLARSGELSMA